MRPLMTLAEKQAAMRSRQLAAKQNARKRKRQIERRETEALLKLIKESKPYWD